MKPAGISGNTSSSLKRRVVKEVSYIHCGVISLINYFNKQYLNLLNNGNNNGQSFLKGKGSVNKERLRQLQVCVPFDVLGFS